MLAAPTILSLGPPPDLHAERIVGEMLRYLHGEKQRLELLDLLWLIDHNSSAIAAARRGSAAAW